jgi:hypothetical protein
MNGLMRCNMIGETLTYRSVLHAISERNRKTASRRSLRNPIRFLIRLLR